MSKYFLNDEGGDSNSLVFILCEMWQSASKCYVIPVEFVSVRIHCHIVFFDVSEQRSQSDSSVLQCTEYRCRVIMYTQAGLWWTLKRDIDLDITGFLTPWYWKVIPTWNMM